MTSATTSPALSLDPLRVLRGIGSLRRLVGSYPADHPMITQKMAEIEGLVRLHLQGGPVLQIDVIHSEVHVDGISFGRDQQANAQMIRELTDLGVPVAIGASRKSFLGILTGTTDPDERLFASIAAAVSAYRDGARIFRVHDVGATKDALLAVEAWSTHER